MSKRILLIAESVTLAQVVRLATLAKGLDPSRYEVHFACSEFAPLVFENARFKTWPLRAVDKMKVLEKVERGEWAYDEAVLKGYVEDELALIDQIKPDMVVGDFRLSLAVSAPLRQVPYAALINAYWSPYAVRDGFPVPDHPILKLVGLARATKYFPQALPLAFKHFAAPLNKLRQRHGLPPVGSLLEVLTFGDFTLYADSPELCPTQNLPATHRYLGHIPWSPGVEVPEAATQGDPSVPLVYVTLGSSGNLAALKAVLAAISDMPVRALLATAGRRISLDLPKNVAVTDFAPGEDVARKAAVVVTNGGASTSYQALAVGTPVLGLPSNLDQYLAMTAIERAGAGRLVRAGSATVDEVRAGISNLIDSPMPRQQAQRVSESFAQIDCHSQFSNVLEMALS
jgi:UDP:flavonoid glycosyltransferase YjiC (YdhE family)